LRGPAHGRLAALGGTTGLPASLVRLGIARPGAVLGFWLLAAAASALGIGQLSIEATVESTLDQEHPAWTFYQESQALFGGDEIVVLLFEADRPLGRETLERIARLTEELESVPDVRRVDSLASMPVVRTQPDGSLDLRPGYLPGLSAEEVGRRIAPDRIAPDYLVSEDGRWLAINLILEREDEKDIAKILDAVEQATRGLDVHVSGVPVFRAETNRRIQRELMTFVPLSVLLLGGILLVLFRSGVAVIVPLAANGVGAWILFGVVGMSGGTLTISTAVLPTILLALGTAYSMHLLSAASLFTEPGQRRERLLAAAAPIAISGLTTAVGFVAISLVRIPVIRDVGGYGALGVLVILGVSLTACPAMLTLWPIRNHRRNALGLLSGPVAVQLGRLALERRRAIIGGFLDGERFDLAVVDPPTG